MNCSPLVEFEFLNLDFDLLEESEDDLYVKIDRECRTEPFVGMKQPTPPGGMLGFETVLNIKHLGRNAVGYRWELHDNTDMIQNGTTDIKGRSGDLHVPLAYGKPTFYRLSVFPPEEINEPEPDAT